MSVSSVVNCGFHLFLVWGYEASIFKIFIGAMYLKYLLFMYFVRHYLEPSASPGYLSNHGNRDEDR